MRPDGVHCVPCPKQGNKIKSVVLNMVCMYIGFFFLNRVRVLNPQLLTYTQLVEYPLSRNEQSAWWRQN